MGYGQFKEKNFPSSPLAPDMLETHTSPLVFTPPATRAISRVEEKI